MKPTHCQSQVINMHVLLQQCIKLSFEGCQIVRDCFQNKDVKQFQKQLQGPVTQADWKIQTMLIKGIRKIYPNIKIIGEQQVEYQGEINIDYEKMKNIQLPKAVKFNKQYKLEDVCLWIDPIDNTRGFIEGVAQAVTVLIGISHKGKAQVGIIGIPFKIKQNNKAVYSPTVMIGCASQHFTFQLFQQSHKWQTLLLPPPSKTPIVVMSPTRKNTIQSSIIQQIKGQKHLAGGAGYKCVLVAKGQADLLAYCQQYTKKWDSCAGDAVIKSLGGYFIDTHGNQLIYDHTAKKYVNQQGIICGFVQKYKQVVIQICKKYR